MALNIQIRLLEYIEIILLDFYQDFETNITNFSNFVFNL